jgi:tetratricopeptide (TPR) repeat protein
MAVYERRALGYLENNEFSRAIADYSEAIATNPRVKRTYLGLGVASAFLHNIDGTRASFEQAQRLEPNDCKTRMLSALLVGVSAGVQRVEVLRDILGGVMSETGKPGQGVRQRFIHFQRRSEGSGS